MNRRTKDRVLFAAYMGFVVLFAGYAGAWATAVSVTKGLFA